MPILLQDLSRVFGKQSDLALSMIPAYYRAIDTDSATYQRWYNRFAPTAPKSLILDALAARYHLDDYQPYHLIFALQTYYAMVIKVLAASRLGSVGKIHAIEDGSHFERYGIVNFVSETDEYHGALMQVDCQPILDSAAQVDFSNPIPDALKSLYHDLFPRTLRHTLGEYYTPDWLAHFVLDRAQLEADQRVLDPTCGSGTFIVLAYRRLLAAGITNPLQWLAGIDLNPLACLATKANLILNMPLPSESVTLPIHCADVLLDPPDIGTFDVIVGNPPWVNWETLPQAYRQRTQQLWQYYGLFPFTGFEAILGKGKKDLSLVLTYAVIDRYLKQQGQLIFLMTQSILKAGGAAQGFRRFEFPNHALQPVRVDDFSKLRIFQGAETKPIVLLLSNDAPQRPAYHLWSAVASQSKTIAEDSAANIIDSLQRSDFVAEPVKGKGSPWLTGEPAALQAVRKITGSSDYQAHAGAYSGGANGVYWLEILEDDGNLVRVQNIVKGAKRRVPEVICWLEKALIYPLLRGRDVKRWHAKPSVNLLVVQNPQTRKGYDEDWLQAHYPLTHKYLQQFEAILKARATYKRYFSGAVPFYTMFDIGTYTFSPYKVVWHGFGKRRMQAVVVSTVGQQPIMTNQAMHPFIGLEDADEAHYLTACLNSMPFEFALLSQTQVGGKSFAQPGMLEKLRLPKFDRQQPAHQELARLSREAHQGRIDDEAIAATAADVWRLTVSELSQLQSSLQDLLA